MKVLWNKPTMETETTKWNGLLGSLLRCTHIHSVLRYVPQCSKTCGFGRKHRPVTCHNRQGVEVSSHLCDVQTKPKTRRRCAEFPCPYIWNTGPWSPVSRGLHVLSQNSCFTFPYDHAWSVQFKIVFTCLRKPSCASLCPSEMSPMLSLKWF